MSKNVTPASNPRLIAAIESLSSIFPQPNSVPSPQTTGPPLAQHPSPIALPSMPECPRVRLAVPTVFSIDLPSAKFVVDRASVAKA